MYSYVLRANSLNFIEKSIESAGCINYIGTGPKHRFNELLRLLQGLIPRRRVIAFLRNNIFILIRRRLKFVVTQLYLHRLQIYIFQMIHYPDNV